jgi:transposase
MTTQQIACTFQVSKAWARRVKQVWRETGRTTPLPRGGATYSKIDGARLAELVEEQPDATLRELRDRLGAECSESAICLALKRLNLTYKKRRSMRPSRIAPMLRSGVRAGVNRSRSGKHGD